MEAVDYLAIFHQAVGIVLFLEEKRENGIVSLGRRVPQGNAAVIVEASLSCSAVQQKLNHLQMASSRGKMKGSPARLQRVFASCKVDLRCQETYFVCRVDIGSLPEKKLDEATMTVRSCNVQRRSSMAVGSSQKPR